MYGLLVRLNMLWQRGYPWAAIPYLSIIEDYTF